MRAGRGSGGRAAGGLQYLDRTQVNCGADSGKTGAYVQSFQYSRGACSGDNGGYTAACYTPAAANYYNTDQCETRYTGCNVRAQPPIPTSLAGAAEEEREKGEVTMQWSVECDDAWHCTVAPLQATYTRILPLQPPRGSPPPPTAPLLALPPNLLPSPHAWGWGEG